MKTQQVRCHRQWFIIGNLNMCMCVCVRCVETVMCAVVFGAIRLEKCKRMHRTTTTKMTLHIDIVKWWNVFRRRNSMNIQWDTVQVETDKNKIWNVFLSNYQKNVFFFLSVKFTLIRCHCTDTSHSNVLSSAANNFRFLLNFKKTVLFDFDWITHECRMFKRKKNPVKSTWFTSSSRARVGEKTDFLLQLFA